MDIRVMYVPPTAVLICFLTASCMPAARSPAQREEAEKKFAEYQLARVVAARSQTCFDTLLPELRAMVEGSDGAPSAQEFAAQWGLKSFDPNTGFDDAWSACVGKPTLQDAGIGDNEAPLKFLERKRSEWEQADPAGAAASAAK
jgi:hypothetical protein